MLISAHAGAIPLPDEAVQCVVTSPPYWGLRKYAGEQERIWPSGDRAIDPLTCAHEWATAVVTRVTGGGERPPDNKWKTGPERDQPSANDTCVRCGAWRGAYGLEPTVEMYVAHTVEILREVRRVLRADGVCFFNLGDSYASGGTRPSPSLSVKHAPSCGSDGREFRDWTEIDCACSCHDDERSGASSRRNAGTIQRPARGGVQPSPKDRDSGRLGCGPMPAGVQPHASVESKPPASLRLSRECPSVRFCSGCLPSHRWASESSISGTLYHVPKPKDLCLIPQRVALAAQADGWWVRSLIVWSKPNPMPESVTDRPTDAYEHILMLTRSSRYYWDAEAVKEASDQPDRVRADKVNGNRPTQHSDGGMFNGAPTRNMRNVWTFPTQPYSGAHFATFPEELPRRCILAATSAKGACRMCGKPWERVVRSTTRFESGSGKAGTPREEIGGKWEVGGENGNANIKLGPVVDSQTIGWRPGCECRGQRGVTVPCVVLDPFGGSGTTGRVAVELGRRAVLCDVGYREHYEIALDFKTHEEMDRRLDYLPLARGRTSHVQPVLEGMA